MSAKNFSTSLSLTLVYEGGWSDNPTDPGGATMRGVTQAVYDDYRRGLGKPSQSVRLISNAELTAVYKWRYWSRIAGDALPLGVDYAVFDYAVNSGVSRAARTLQGLVGAKPDGMIGQGTVNAVTGYVAAHGAVALTDAICDQRIKFLTGQLQSMAGSRAMIETGAVAPVHMHISLNGHAVADEALGDRTAPWRPPSFAVADYAI